MKTILVCILSFFCIPLFSELAKHEFVVCAFVKNEAKYMKEWIEYHRLIGVDHFYLYNNGSTDRIYRILRPYIRRGVVTWIDWSQKDLIVPEEETFLWSLGMQIPAFENALRVRALDKAEWIVFLNIDEYLVPIEADNMKQLLRKYRDFPGVVLTTDVFDASQVNLSAIRPLVTASKELIKGPSVNVQRTFVKQIMKVQEYAGFTWPPYQPLFKGGRKPAVLKRSLVRVNQYANRDEHPIRSFRHTVYLDKGQIGSEEMLDFLEKGYAIEDPEKAIFRYLPDLAKKCSADPGSVK